MVVLRDTSRTKRMQLRAGRSRKAAQAASYRRDTDDAADAGELVLNLRGRTVYHGHAWWKLTRVGLPVMSRFWLEVASWNV